MSLFIRHHKITIWDILKKIPTYIRSVVWQNNNNYNPKFQDRSLLTQAFKSILQHALYPHLYGIQLSHIFEIPSISNE